MLGLFGGELARWTISRPASSVNIYNGKELAAGPRAHHVHINLSPSLAPDFLGGRGLEQKYEESPETMGKIVLSYGC